MRRTGRGGSASRESEGKGGREAGREGGRERGRERERELLFTGVHVCE